MKVRIFSDFRYLFAILNRVECSNGAVKTNGNLPLSKTFALKTTRLQQMQQRFMGFL